MPVFRSRPFIVFILFMMLFAGKHALANEAMASNSPQVVLSTNHGDIVLELNAERAPQTVDNFLSYVESGFYDNTLFHRVIDGFMIQGGGFDQQYQRKATRAPISNEAYNGLKNNRYTIAMARTTAPHSATAQFFINSVDNRNLDHTATTQRGWGYAVFGKVIQGREVVDAISQVPTGRGGHFSRDVPREPVVILSAKRLVPPLNGAASGNAANRGPSGKSTSTEGNKLLQTTSETGAEKTMTAE